MCIRILFVNKSQYLVNFYQNLRLNSDLKSLN